VLAFTISACSSPDLTEQQELAGELASTLVAKIPTRTAYPTYTPYPTYTQLPPVYIVVTATLSPTPLQTSTATITPTITLIPTETPLPSPTTDPATKIKQPGFYLVGVEFAPGIWRSMASGDDCYWSITARNGEIINNHFGQAGGTMYVPPDAFQVQLDPECGSWEYLSPP